MTVFRNWILVGMTAALSCLSTLTLGLAAPSHAQTAAVPAVGSAFTLSAMNPDSIRFDTASLRGKVTVVFFWSTNCAVCRDKLGELRANLAGWRDKPFSLVLVNVDRKVQDWLAYERVILQRIEGRVAPELWDGVAELLL